MCDIALRLSSAGLGEFAAQLNASPMSQWEELGLTGRRRMGAGVQQAVSNTRRWGTNPV